MKLNIFYFCLILSLSITSCTAQIDVLSATKGNTGHRGILPRDENGNHIEQPKGRDYYALEMKVKKACTIELMSLMVKTNEGQIFNLTPSFTDGDAKKNKITANQTFYVRAERDDSAKAIKQIVKGEGLLKAKINGKVKTLAIENFTLTLPQ